MGLKSGGKRTGIWMLRLTVELPVTCGGASLEPDIYNLKKVIITDPKFSKLLLYEQNIITFWAQYLLNY